MKPFPVLLLTLAACRMTAVPRPLPREEWMPLARLVDSAVASGVAPGAVVGISLRGRRFFHGTGVLGENDPTRPDAETVYDLASLTKVIVLTTAFMLAVDEGMVSLDDPVRKYLPEFEGDPKERVTIRHLLTHSSGLPAHRRLWIEAPDRDSALALVLATPLDTLPGSRTVYSDLGIIVLTQVIERLYGTPLEVLADQRIVRPLGLRHTRFLPPRDWRGRIAPTERDPWRGRVLRGEVHDENAAWLGGVSGHAGLFASAEDLVTFGEWMLADRGGDRSDDRNLPAPPRSLEEFTRRAEVVPGSSRALGWDTPSSGGSAGTRLSALSFGHTGFTGTSIWIDPQRGLVVVLLSNRVHPSRVNTSLLRLRPVVADCAALVADRLPCPI